MRNPALRTKWDTPLTQGDPGTRCILWRDGFVQVVYEREDGTKRVPPTCVSGEYFGEYGAARGRDTVQASVLTAGKCELIKIRATDFLELCRQYPRRPSGKFAE